jgi:hypothetical protein
MNEKSLITGYDKYNYCDKFMERAKHNLEFMNIAFNLSFDPKIKEKLGIDEEFHAYVSCLAKIGYKSDNHFATIYALEYFFMHKQKLLEKEYIKILEKAKLEKEYIERLFAAKTDRETAQLLGDISE